jgi:hypothetical protein
VEGPAGESRCPIDQAVAPAGPTCDFSNIDR